MNRNEYRRAFIMLRAAMPGYGGHARLERRMLTGSMYFIITAPQGVNELSAALVGRQGDDYFAVPIGALKRDRRGQLALAWQFDPRSIDGRPLEAYAWVAVVTTGGPCALALTGNVDGARAMDLSALARAACALFAPADTPAADLPEPTEPMAESVEPEPAEPVPVPEPEPAEPARSPQPEPAEPVAGEMRGDVRIYTSTRARLRSAARRRAEARTQAGGAAPGTPATDDPGSADLPSAPHDPPVTAARKLGLDITAPWPGPAESLRRLFATQAALPAPLPDGFTYVRAPLPGASGDSERLVGMKAEAGRITGLRYLLPGRRAPESPAGLEGYRWMPTVGDAGYWMLEDDRI